jgi:hypothetical protein
LIQNVFGKSKKLNYEDYIRINQEVSSEMFLSLMTLFQTNLPCSTNYYRYKNNYEKYLSGDNSNPNPEPEASQIKSIASPKLMSKLSPISQFVNN